MQRVMIIGGSGSGKSTLARALGQRTGMPVIHMDQLYWLPGWVERPGNEFNKMVGEIAKQDDWILDGNYSNSFDSRLTRADTLIFLDLTTLTRVRRVWWRTLTAYGQTRPDLTNDCPERFDLEFLLRFVPGYHSRGGRDRALALLDRALPQVQVQHFRTTTEVRNFLSAQ